MTILEEFDLLVEPYNKYPVVKRICPSCAATHTESQTHWQVIGWAWGLVLGACASQPFPKGQIPGEDLRFDRLIL